MSKDLPFFDPNSPSCFIQGDPKNQEGSGFGVGLDLSGTTSTTQIAAFLMQGGQAWVGRLARCGYWLVIAVGTVLLFGREQEFHILKILFGVGLPVAFIWVCCSSFRLMLMGAAARFAEAQVGLARVAITYPGSGSWLKVAGCLAAVTVVSFLYFAGLIDLKSVEGFQTALLAAP